MDLRQLATFRMVATTLNFSQAARVLGYAQSTVTMQIQALEADLGVTLFNRLGKNIQLTEAGTRLLIHSERLLEMAEETRNRVTGSASLTGTLVIGAPETICTYRLPPVLRRFRAEMPGIRLIFRPLTYAELLKHAKDGTLDLTFLLQEPIHSSQLHIEPLRREPMTIIAAPDHHLAHCENVLPADLEYETLLLTERGCGYRRLFERVLHEAGIFPAAQMEFHSVEAIKQCVMANVGVAILPLVAVEESLAAGQLVALKWGGAGFNVMTSFAWQAQQPPAPALSLFIELSRTLIATGDVSYAQNLFESA